MASSAQDFAVADDRVERRAQLVAHIGEEARLGFATQPRLRRGPRSPGRAAIWISRALSRNTIKARLMSPSSSRAGGRDRRREIALRDAEHAVGEVIEPRHHIAVHEQPDDQARNDQGRHRDQEEPDAARRHRAFRELLRLRAALASASATMTATFSRSCVPSFFQRFGDHRDRASGAQELLAQREDAARAGGLSGESRGCGLQRRILVGGDLRNPADHCPRWFWMRPNTSVELLVQRFDAFGAVGLTHGIQDAHRFVEFASQLVELRDPTGGLAKLGGRIGAPFEPTCAGLSRSTAAVIVRFAAVADPLICWNTRVGIWLAAIPSPTVRLRSPTWASIRAIRLWIGTMA